MLSNVDKIYKEINSFLKEVSDCELPIINTSFMTKQPAVQNRIEFKLENFRNLSHNYVQTDKSGRRYTLGVDATYKAQLIIRVISFPEQASIVAGNISNALQIFEYRNMYMPSISLLNHTLRQKTVSVEEDGMIFNLEQIIVDCNMVLPYDVTIPHFDKIEKVEVIIKEK